jgi:hypothetical protein
MIARRFGITPILSLRGFLLGVFNAGLDNSSRNLAVEYGNNSRANLHD